MKQTASTAVFVIVCVLMFWKVVLPTLRDILPFMKTHLMPKTYWSLTAVILSLEFAAWWVIAEIYLLIMHSYLV